jgi:hypothetical protein
MLLFWLLGSVYLAVAEKGSYASQYDYNNGSQAVAGNFSEQCLKFPKSVV